MYAHVLSRMLTIRSVAWSPSTITNSLVYCLTQFLADAEAPNKLFRYVKICNGSSAAIIAKMTSSAKVCLDLSSRNGPARSC